MTNNVIAGTGTGGATALPVANSIDGSNDYIPIYTASATATQAINRNTYLNIASQPVGLTDTQSLSNKTLGITTTLTILDSLFTLEDNGDNTKKLQFQLSGITTGNTRTLTVPDASDTIVGLAATQTLTNKTLTSPTINSPTITNATISSDSITGYSASTSGTIYGIGVTSGQFSGNAIIIPNNLVASTGTTWAYSGWNITPTGYTGTPSQYGHYIQIGKTVILEFSCTGTSNATTATIQLPVAPKANATYTLFVTDNSSVATSPGQLQLTGASLTGNVYKTMASGAWTSSGTKAFFGFGVTYEAN